MHKNKTNSERKMPKNPQVSKRLSKFGIKGALNNTNLMNLCDGYKLSTRGTRNEMIERIVKHLKDTYGNDDNNDKSSPRLTDASGTSSSGDSSGTSSSDNDTSSEEDNNNENEDSLENTLNALSEDDADDDVPTKKSPVDVRFTFFLNGTNITKIDSQGPRAKLTILTSYGIERTIESTVDTAEDFGSLIDMSDKNCKYDVLQRNDKLRWYVSNPFNTKVKLELSDYNDNGVEDEIERLANKGQGFVLDVIIPLKKRFIVEIDNHAIEELPMSNNSSSNNSIEPKKKKRKISNSTTSTTTSTTTTAEEKTTITVHYLSDCAVEKNNNKLVTADKLCPERTFELKIDNATMEMLRKLLFTGKDRALYNQKLHIKTRVNSNKLETLRDDDNNNHLKTAIQMALKNKKDLFIAANKVSDLKKTGQICDDDFFENLDYNNLTFEDPLKESSFNDSNSRNILIEQFENGLNERYNDPNSKIYHGISQRQRMQAKRELSRFTNSKLKQAIQDVKHLNFSFQNFQTTIVIAKGKYLPDDDGAIPVDLTSSSSSASSSSGSALSPKDQFYMEELQDKKRFREQELKLQEKRLDLERRKFEKDMQNNKTPNNNNSGFGLISKKIEMYERVSNMALPDEMKKKLYEEIDAQCMNK